LEEGTDILEKLLESIEHSPAIYTLKLFKQRGTKEIIINEKTVCDLSFNFKLNDAPDIYTRPTGRGVMARERITIEQLNEKLDAVINGEQAPQEKSIGEVIGEALRDPVKLNEWIGTIRDIKNLFAPTMQPAGMGNFQHATAQIPAAPGGADNIADPAAEKILLVERLSEAIDRLEKNDPKIVEHIEKLASISEQNPALFKMLITNLETL